MHSLWKGLQSEQQPDHTHKVEPIFSKTLFNSFSSSVSITFSYSFPPPNNFLPKTQDPHVSSRSDQERLSFKTRLSFHLLFCSKFLSFAFLPLKFFLKVHFRPLLASYSFLQTILYETTQSNIASPSHEPSPTFSSHLIPSLLLPHSPHCCRQEAHRLQTILVRPLRPRLPKKGQQRLLVLKFLFFHKKSFFRST